MICKKNIFLLLVLHLVLNINSFAKEVLEDRFRVYHALRTELYKSINDGPLSEIIDAGGKTVEVYSPQINDETLDMKPRPKKIAEAIKHPGKFFAQDAAKAVESYVKYAKEYRDCYESKKWPDNSTCFDSVKICFDKYDDSSGFCGWQKHEVISDYATDFHGPEGLIKALHRYSKVLEYFSKCFDEKVYLSFMFDVYGKEATRRSYYTVDTYFYNDTLKGTRCRFTVLDGEYNLILMGSHEFGRPGLSMVPRDIYVRDNYYGLLKYQKLVKGVEAENERLKKKKRIKK